MSGNTGKTSGDSTAISRPLVGLITLACLGTWATIGVLHWTGAADASSARLQMWWAGFGRVGLVMFALWLALPSGDRPAAWANVSKPMLVVFGLMGVLVAVRPVRLAILLPMILLVALASVILRPRARHRPSTRVG